MNNDYCLTLMGIPIWKERPVASECFLKPLNTIENPQYAILVGPEGSTMGIEAKTLLKNLLQAIHWPMKECAFFQWTEKPNQVSLSGIKASLNFGSAPVSIPNSCELPSIDALLQDNAQKKQAWKKLQELRKRS